jgi:peptide/nickel transport system permease protein
MTIGLSSGFFGGKLDLIVQRFVDARMCFPWTFLILTVMSLIGPGLLQATIVIGTVWGVACSRIIRSAVIAIKENMYVDAAIAVGCTPTRMLTKHILPNIMATVVIIFTMSIGQIILVEATISFLGFGVPPPNPSWGGMISLEGRRFMLMAPWLAIWPGVALCLVVYGFNMLGDAVRDVLDPRLRGGLGRYGRAEKKTLGK